MSSCFNSRVSGSWISVVLIGLVCLGAGCWSDANKVEKKDLSSYKPNQQGRDEKKTDQKDSGEDNTSRDPFVGKKAGEEQTFSSLKMNFCWCPPGKFQMGSPKDEAERFENEELVDVTLTQGYWLGKYEVTQKEYKKIMGTNPSRFEGERLPVENASWEDATKFCKKLTVMDQTAGLLPMGWGYRLPTEAQWEHACRAGSTTAYSFGNDVEKLGEFCWYRNNSSRKTHEVGQKRSNAWGLYDMHGNVAEWCKDAWNGETVVPGGENPEVAEGWRRVLRGGGWYEFHVFCRSAYRYAHEPSWNLNLGFRVARGPIEQVR